MSLSASSAPGAVAPALAGTGLTAALAAYAAHGLDRPLFPAAATPVRNGFIDTLAVLLAGRDQPVVDRLLAYLQARGRLPGTCHALLAQPGWRAADAALVNATAAHALDYDDVGLQGHPSAVLVPALLAEGERLGSSGAAVMRAYQVGYEVWAELIGRDLDLHHLKGWHPTAVFGVVAVAAAVIALRRLPVAQAVHALGLAATQASGLVANFGSMAKPLHAGLAAAHGIEAVDMALAGITASPDALEHHAGFLMALSPKGRADRLRATEDFDAGPRLPVLGLSIKKYPMCFATHRVIDAMLDLARGQDLQADDIEGLHATIGPAQASMLRNHAPQSALEAKFSLEFALAAAAVARQVGLAQLQDDFVQRSDVQALMRRVSLSVVDSASPVEPSLAEADTLEVTLRDGRVLESGKVRFARGTPRAPLAEGELEAKYRDCVREASDVDTDTLWHLLQQLDTLDDVGRLSRLALPVA